jgi:hypothetical protein
MISFMMCASSQFLAYDDNESTICNLVGREADMQKINLPQRILTITGTVLVLLPVVAPTVFAFAALFTRHQFLFDFLMPGELFPVVLIGAVLLLICAFLRKEHRALISGLFSAALILLFGSQGLAVITGVADGSTAEGTWQFYLIVGLFILYDLVVIAIGVFGIFQIRKVFQTTPRLDLTHQPPD